MDRKNHFSGISFFKNVANRWFFLIGAMVSIQFLLGQNIAELNETLWTVLFAIAIGITIVKYFRQSD